MASDAHDPAEEPRQSLAKGAFAIVFSVSFVTAVGNTGLQSVLPAIGREIGVQDWLVAAIYSLSALLWAAGAPHWAKRADVRGRKPLMVLGLVGFAISMLLCTGVIFVGGLRVLPVGLIFVAFLLSRALFGWLGSAAPPASQAYLTDRSHGQKRTDLIAGLAGSFGLGTIIGPAIAPMFLFPILGLAGPTFAFALMALGVMVWVVTRLPETWPIPGHAVHPAAHHAAPAHPMWKDPRVRPFLIYGFLVSTCQTAQYQTLGFLIIDTLHIAPMAAQPFTAIAMIAGALAGLFAQWGLIRVFKLGPRVLLRWGVILAAIANVMTAFTPHFWVLVVAFALSSLGYGFARPGFTAGASLSVPEKDQARAAGAVSAVIGLNTVAAPLFVFVYQHFRPGPYVMNVVILGAMAIYVLREPLLRYAGIAPTTERQTAKSVERNDASSGF